MSASRTRRLWLRFALSSLIAFIAIGTGLTVLRSRQLRDEEERAASYHAQFVSQSLFRYEITPADLEAPVDPSSDRYRELRKFVLTRVIRFAGEEDLFPVVRIKIWAKDGTVLFSDEPRLVGRRFAPDDELEEAYAGESVAGVSNLRDAENQYERGVADKLFATYVPLTLDPAGPKTHPDAVVELYTDYAGIQAQISGQLGPLFMTMLAGLAVLYALMLPISLRVARTLSEQNQALENQATWLSSLLEKEQQSVTRLKELNRLKDNFVAVASHELRTPLTSILGFVKTLKQPGFAEDTTLREEFLGATERQAERLVGLVENLLATSQVEHGQGRIAVSSFACDEAIGHLVEGLGARRVRVDVTVPEGIRLFSDQHLLGLILQNLIDNALKFSPEGGHCEVKARKDGETVVIEVRDSGIGIPQDQIARVFDRFYQVDSSSTRPYGGVGLGLSLVKDLVHRLGGRIEVASIEGEGTTFTLRLPLVHPQVAEVKAKGDEPGWAGWSKIGQATAQRP